MAATAAVNRTPPVHPVPNGGNLHARPNTGLPNSGQQDPALHGTSQDLGPSFHPQHHVSARPILFVPAPPPTPFLQYQWPMPFSYNPFASFPGMGYGMVMPPFPPPHYMEAPTYILPHHHVQPVDYRRLPHTQVQAPSAPYQNPNQNRRIRPPHAVSVRETVNSAVQTEPTQRGTGVGSPLTSADSGHGTASNSPSSSSSNSQKRGSAEVENYTSSCGNAKDIQDNRPCTNSTVKHGFNIQNPTGKKTAQSCIRATVGTQKCHKDSVVQENVPHYRNGHRNMWSGSSPESMVPVCSSSQQEDEVVKERCVSIPDILMSWGSGTPQAITDKMLTQDDQLPSYHTEGEHENSVDQNPTETNNGPVVADSDDANDDAEKILSVKDTESILKILKLPFALQELLSESRREHEPVELVGSSRHGELLHSLSKSHQLPDNEQEKSNATDPCEDTAEITPYQMSFNSCQIKRKINESVWSVESLAPFIPTEWLLQKSTFEPDIIIEMTEDAENGGSMTQNDNLIVKSSKERRQSYRLSLSDSVPMSESLLIFSTPAEKVRPSEKPETESETDVSVMRGPKQGQSMTPSEKDPIVSLTHPPSNMILSTSTEEDVEEIRSSEPEANQSPNQVSFTVNEQQEKSSCSHEQEETLLLNAELEKILPMGQQILEKGGGMKDDGAYGNKVSQLREDHLCVPMDDHMMDDVSPSKGHLVDCGIQCTELREFKCSCEEQGSSIGPSRRHPFKNSDMKKENRGKAEAFCPSGPVQKNQRRHNQWRNRGQDSQSSQKEAYNGYCSKPIKSKGGHGRNPRY